MSWTWNGEVAFVIVFVIYFVPFAVFGYIYKFVSILEVFFSNWFLYFSLGQIVDTVVMNPPFGTRKKGVDMDFLHAALKVSKHGCFRTLNI